jgi:hypothetical protein
MVAVVRTDAWLGAEETTALIGIRLIASHERYDRALLVSLES